jgi:predicted nucleic acid-binding Zn ribbon protein
METGLKRYYKKEQPTIKDPDRVCTICNKGYKAVAPLQKTCSKECRRIKDRKHQKDFYIDNPNARSRYTKTVLDKNPDHWRNKNRKERLEIIQKLGCICKVPMCGVSNPLHLHVDYIPTMIGTGFRHPRHKRWVLDNIKDFRLLCANHHYELTITGQIEGSDITQKRKNDK